MNRSLSTKIVFSIFWVGLAAVMFWICTDNGATWFLDFIGKPLS